jgi:hypothetical protein
MLTVEFRFERFSLKKAIAKKHIMNTMLLIARRLFLPAGVVIAAYGEVSY